MTQCIHDWVTVRYWVDGGMVHIRGEGWQRPADTLSGALLMIQEDLYILPSALENSLLDVALTNPAAQKDAVREVCMELRRNGFDLVMVDCPPSLGAAVISTICAAHIIVIPVGHDTFSLRGMRLTRQEIRSICRTFSLEPPVEKILYTNFDRRLKLSTERLRQLYYEFNDTLVPVPIRTSSEYSKSLAEHRTIFASTNKSYAKHDYDLYDRHFLGLDSAAKTSFNPNGGDDPAEQVASQLSVIED